MEASTQPRLISSDDHADMSHDNAIKELPSHYFRRNVYLTFIDEPDAVRHAHDRLGIENIMWSSDYPHPVSSWPNSRATVDKMFHDVDPKDRDLLVCGNAARVWNL